VPRVEEPSTSVEYRVKANALRVKAQTRAFFEQARICLSNRKIAIASTGRPFHCKMVNTRSITVNLCVCWPNLFSHSAFFNYMTAFGFPPSTLAVELCYRDTRTSAHGGCVVCLPADKPWGVVSAIRRSSGVAPWACVRGYARVCWCRRIFTYIHAYRVFVSVCCCVVQCGH